MAKITVVKLTDDLDGTEATETVQFSVHGKAYEIDLSDKNVAAFDKALEEYVAAARKPEPRKPARAIRTSAERDYDLPALREWAAAKGVKVAAKGRIAREVVEQYKADGGK